VGVASECVRRNDMKKEKRPKDHPVHRRRERSKTPGEILSTGHFPAGDELGGRTGRAEFVAPGDVPPEWSP
jgi:hypothetical protein